jgi:hypothetical protein
MEDVNVLHASTRAFVSQDTGVRTLRVRILFSVSYMTGKSTGSIAPLE